MISHKSRIKVNLSVYVDVITDSHPEDIDELTMKHLLADRININGSYDDKFDSIKSFEIEDVLQAVDVEVEIIK